MLSNEPLQLQTPRPADLEGMMFVRKGHIFLDARRAYAIPLDRCNTHADILGWALHLSEKSWASRELLRRFIKLALEAKGLAYPAP